MQYKEKVTKLATIARNINEQHTDYLDSLKKGYSEIERDGRKIGMSKRKGQNARQKSRLYSRLL